MIAMLRRALTLAYTLAAIVGCTRTMTLNEPAANNGVADAGDAAAPADDGAAPRDGRYGFGGDWGGNCTSFSPLGWPLKVTPVPLWILLDSLSAMKMAFDGTSRGAAASNALTTTIKKYQYSINFGFSQFPSSPSDPNCKPGTCCSGALVPPVNNPTSVLQGVACGDPQGTPCFSPSADSPSYDALAKVWDSVKANTNQEVDQFVLLMTASDPSCSADTTNSNFCNIDTTINNLVSHNVYIFVLPVGASFSSTSCMSSISKLGPGLSGISPIDLTPATTQATLGDTLDAFVRSVAKRACTINLGRTTTIPSDPSRVQINFDNNTTPIDKNTWVTNRSTVTFSGTSCDKIVDSKVGSISLSTTCNTCGGPNPCYQQP